MSFKGKDKVIILSSAKMVNDGNKVFSEREQLCVEYRKTYTFAWNSNSCMSVGRSNEINNKECIVLICTHMEIKQEVPVMVNFMYQLGHGVHGPKCLHIW